MPREGTRSATGNSRPRVFQTVDTAPTITRKKPATARTKKAPTAGAGPVTKAKTKAKVATAPKSGGVTKKKAAPKKATAGSKVSCALCDVGPMRQISLRKLFNEIKELRVEALRRCYDGSNVPHDLTCRQRLQ